MSSAKKLIKKTLLSLKDYEKTFESNRIIKDGIKIVILGIPNSGKSTLINYLSRKEVAIVSNKAGTTRDILNQKLNINGIPVTIYDTAGLRKSKDDIETEGNTRALNLSKLADIKIYIGANNLKKPFGNINIDRTQITWWLLINQILLKDIMKNLTLLFHLKIINLLIIYGIKLIKE